MVPRSLVLKEITLTSNVQVNSGGFGEIFQGIYKDELVALKRLKLYSRNPDTEKAVDVSVTCLMDGGLIVISR